MKHGSLFSGIGGFDLAAEQMGWENVFQVEWDGFCQKVLAKNFPNVKRYGDIKEFDGTKYRGFIDIISGGFPCQPFSHAGKRKGTSDDRYLWPEMLRVIKEVKPSFVVGENVAGLVSMENGKTLERILSDLENEGYQTESFIIPACAVGAWHRRDRIWIIAHIKPTGLQRRLRNCEDGEREGIPTIKHNGNQVGCEVGCVCGSNGQDASNSISQRGRSREAGGEYAEDVRKQSGSAEHGYWNLESSVGGMAYGLPSGMDGYWDREPEGIPRVATGVKNRVDRLKGLGNAIVPQVAFQLFKAIENVDKY